MSTMPAARHHDPVDHDFSTLGGLVGAVVGDLIGTLLPKTPAKLHPIGKFPVWAGWVKQTAFRIKSFAIKKARKTVENAPQTAASKGGAAGGAAAGSQVHSASQEIKDGSDNVFTNKRRAARILDPVTCDESIIAEGSLTVIINERPASRKGDQTKCGGTILEGSPDVFFGGPKTTQTKIGKKDYGLLGAVGKGAASGAGKAAMKGKDPVAGGVEGGKKGGLGYLKGLFKKSIKGMFGF